MKDIEGNKEMFQLNKLLEIKRLSWEALDEIAANIRVGMRESEATVMANQVLKNRGAKLSWHKTYIRFSHNTLNYFRVKSESDPVLGKDDILFIDIGPVWDGYEGDVGNTFVMGSNPEYLKIQSDVKVVFEEVKKYWSENKCSGVELYAEAEKIATRMGWLLHLDVKGHRLGDFPHTLFYKGSLGEVDKAPKAYAWVLEIQIRHPSKMFGAFYEDLLF